jgi:hypothetical protein
VIAHDEQEHLHACPHRPISTAAMRSTL